MDYICIIDSQQQVKHPEGFKGINDGSYFVGVNGKCKCKFHHDFILEENDLLLILIVGVVFNRRELIVDVKNNSWFDTVSELYFKNGETFFKLIKGSFNGVLLDKKRNKWIIFSNIQSERPVFFSKLNGTLIVASKINLIKTELCKINQKLNLDIDGAYMLLTHGYMFEGYTLFREVRRLKACCYGVYEAQKYYENEYYRFSNEVFTADSQGDIVNNIDVLFKQAVVQQFEKDREYGFTHVTTLSGGLDARMTVCCAHELGYEKQVNVTFSQSGYLDQTIACEISARLKHEWLFKSLDNGLFMFDIDEVTKFTEGNVLYYGAGIEYSMWKYLNFDTLGILHTGLMGGDGVLNWDYPVHRKPSISDGAFSTRMIHKISESAIDINDYENEEIFIIRNKFLTGQTFGISGIHLFTESFSPFCNLDFWEYCLTIPLKYRHNRNIYKKWIIEKHRLAASFKYDKTGVALKKRHIDRLRLYHNGRVLTIEDAFRALYRRLSRQLNLKYKPSLNAMNPFESWLIVNYELGIFLIRYFNDSIQLLDDHAELKTDCMDLFKAGNALEKIQVLSLLAAMKHFNDI